MVDIPTDIWLYISQFIPKDSVQNLLAVNSIFFNVAMDAKYNEVSIKTLSPATMKTITRLMDPLVASRVRRLNLRLYLKQEPNQHVKVAILDRMANALSFRHRPHNTKASPILFDDLMQGLISIFPGLVNLTKFSIDSWDLHPSAQLESFFSTAWSSFGRNLRVVSLGGNLDGFRVFMASNPPFDSVKELNMEFTDNLFHIDDAVDAATLVEHIASFVNKLGPQLATLRIWSWASADLSSFFLQLGIYPNLRYFSIRAPFNKSFREDPSGLTQLLRNTSSTLQRLELRLNPTGSALNPTTEQSLTEWLWESVSNEELFTNIKALEIYPTLLPLGFDALKFCVQRLAPTLSHLAIRDRYLQDFQIEDIMEALSPHTELTSLRLNLWKLNIEVIDLLANKLPGLKTLSLYAGDVALVGSTWTLEEFRTELQKRSYKDWQVYDIGIWQGGTELDSDTMRLVAQCIPSIRSFWGTGDVVDIVAPVARANSIVTGFS